MIAGARLDVSYRSLKVWRRNLDVFRHLLATEMIWPVLEPMIVLASVGLGLGTFVTLASGQDYVQFINRCFPDVAGGFRNELASL